MNCGQQFGQQMAFGNGFLLRAISISVGCCTNSKHCVWERKIKNIRRKIFRFYGGHGADCGSLPRPKNAPLGHFCPAGRNRGARAVRIHQRNSGKIEKYKKSDTSFEVSLCWWELVDSNHRSIKQQIYSLSTLATRESTHIQYN